MLAMFISIATSIGIAFAVPAEPNAKPTFELACKVTLTDRATMTGFPNQNNTYTYEQVFIIDPPNRLVTQRYGLDPNSDRPRRIESTSVFADVRAIDESRIVFCESDDTSCRVHEETIKGVRVRTTQGLSTIDLSRMSYSTQSRQVMIQRDGTFTYDATSSGRCRRM
jgi:hypothetical protein